jgi:DNA-binding MarR family transcriptional regulator
MTQGQIYTYLLKHPKQWYTVRELSKNLKLSQSATSANILKLHKYDFVRKRIIERNEKNGYIDGNGQLISEYTARLTRR